MGEVLWPAGQTYTVYRDIEWIMFPSILGRKFAS